MILNEQLMMVINKDAIIMEIVVFPLPYTTHPNQKNIRFVIFSVFSFGCLGRNIYLCNDVCNMIDYQWLFPFLRHVCNIRC